MTEQCEIQWFDERGQPTPDDNPPIGRVRTKAATLTTVWHERAEGGAVRKERTLHMPAGEWLRVCTEHANRLRDPDKVEMWEWEWEIAPPDDTPFGTKKAAVAAASDAGGKFIETTGTTDMATWPVETWLGFIESIVAAYVRRLREPPF